MTTLNELYLKSQQLISEKLSSEENKNVLSDIETVHQLEKIRFNYYKLLVEQEVYQKLNSTYSDYKKFKRFEWLKDYAEESSNTKLENDNTCLKLTIDTIPENIYKKLSNVETEKIYKKWVYATYNKLVKYREKLTGNSTYTNVYIVIKTYSKVDRDTDNMFYKPILDGIMQSGLIKDNNSNNVAYVCTCSVDKEYQRTEIFIYLDKNIPSLAKELFF